MNKSIIVESRFRKEFYEGRLWKTIYTSLNKKFSIITYFSKNGRINSIFTYKYNMYKRYIYFFEKNGKLQSKEYYI